MGRRGPVPVFTDELRINVRPDQRSAVVALAEVADVSISAVVRSALDAFLRQARSPEGTAWDSAPTK